MKSKTELVKVTDLTPNPDNPRGISEDKFQKLVQSVKDFPKMMEARPLVVDEDGLILGGNMRYRAALELKWTEVPVIRVAGYSDEEKKQFVIKDNVSFGAWDWDLLANEWPNSELTEWGLDVWNPEFEADYDPVLEPDTSYDDVTREQIEKEAKRLAEQMVKEQKVLEVMCPKCHHEFSVS